MIKGLFSQSRHCFCAAIVLFSNLTDKKYNANNWIFTVQPVYRGLKKNDD